jgi:hypothetical protein
LPPWLTLDVRQKKMQAILACSGPGAMTLIYSNQGYSVQMWYATIGLAVCGLVLWIRRRNRNWLILPTVILSALHPAWTMSATSGDCGYMMFDLSRIILGFAALMLILQIGIYIKTERNEK